MCIFFRFNYGCHEKFAIDIEPNPRYFFMTQAEMYQITLTMADCFIVGVCFVYCACKVEVLCNFKDIRFQMHNNAQFNYLHKSNLTFLC